VPTRKLLNRGGQAVALLTAGVVGGGAAFAVASVPDGTGQIHACVNVTTSGGELVPSQGGATPDVTIIDPSAGQKCIPPDGTIANQTTLSWDVTGPQGPQGFPGAAGAPGSQGAAGAPGRQGATGNGTTDTFTIAPPLLTNRTRPVGRVTLGSGGGALSIAILSVEQPSNTAAKSGGPLPSEITIIKAVDKSSASLFKDAHSGRHIPTVTIDLLRSIGKNPVKYLEAKLGGVTISSIQAQDSSGRSPVPLEAVHLNYGSIHWTYTQQKRT
jgi:type VI protein secretion system component Hcp